MAPVKKKGWVNVYKQEYINPKSLAIVHEPVWETELSARAAARSNVIATVPIEWEE